MGYAKKIKLNSRIGDVGKLQVGIKLLQSGHLWEARLMGARLLMIPNE